MVTVKQRRLGKGLSALMGEEETSKSGKKPASKRAEKGGVQPVEGLLTVPLSSIVVGRYQPRQQFDAAGLDELAKSIKSNGVMQPIVVRGSSEFAGKFEIVAGERRFRACKKAGLKQVPILLRELKDSEALELALVENVQRQDLNPLEEAQGYQRLMEEFSYTQEKLAKAVGKSRSHIANLLRLLALPEVIKKHIHAGKLSMGHARALLTSKQPEVLAKEIIQKGLSVRQAEQLAKQAKQPAESQKKPRQITKSNTGNAPAMIQPTGEKDEEIIALERMLSGNLGLTVQINNVGSQQGQVIISYDTLAELDAILQRLDNG